MIGFLSETTKIKKAVEWYLQSTERKYYQPKIPHPEKYTSCEMWSECEDSPDKQKENSMSAFTP